MAGRVRNLTGHPDYARLREYKATQVTADWVARSVPIRSGSGARK